MPGPPHALGISLLPVLPLPPARTAASAHTDDSGGTGGGSQLELQPGGPGQTPWAGRRATAAKGKRQTSRRDREDRGGDQSLQNEGWEDGASIQEPVTLAGGPNDQVLTSQNHLPESEGPRGHSAILPSVGPVSSFLIVALNVIRAGENLKTYHCDRQKKYTESHHHQNCFSKTFLGKGC